MKRALDEIPPPPPPNGDAQVAWLLLATSSILAFLRRPFLWRVTLGNVVSLAGTLVGIVWAAAFAWSQMQANHHQTAAKLDEYIAAEAKYDAGEGDRMDEHLAPLAVEMKNLKAGQAELKTDLRDAEMRLTTLIREAGHFERMSSVSPSPAPVTCDDEPRATVQTR